MTAEIMWSNKIVIFIHILRVAENMLNKVVFFFIHTLMTAEIMLFNNLVFILLKGIKHI